MKGYKVTVPLPDNLQVTMTCVCGAFFLVPVFREWRKYECSACHREYGMRGNLSAALQVRHQEDTTNWEIVDTRGETEGAGNEGKEGTRREHN